jgi:hypothetical protein
MGREIILAALAFAPLTILSVSGEVFRVTGFEDGEQAGVKSAMNCKHEIIPAAENERAPDGKRHIKITMGGLNDKEGGGVAINLPKDKIPDDAGKISFWIKGSQANTFGPVLMMGDWCWGGKRYEVKAQISVSDDEWVKYEFKLADFVPATARSPREIKQPNKYDCLYICLGTAKSYPDSIVFFLDKIEISNDK